MVTETADAAQHVAGKAHQMQVLEYGYAGGMMVVFCHQDGKFYMAGTVNPPDDDEIWTANPREWIAQHDFAPRRLDLENIVPQYLAGGMMTKATSHHGPHTYVKRPNYIRIARWCGVQQMFTGNEAAQLTMREISTCEILGRNPHPNVAEYLGVVTGTEVRYKSRGTMQKFEKEIVTGLVFKRYETTLTHMVHQRRHFDATKALADIEAGIRHLHQLGLVHTDVKPDNVFYQDGKFVLGDFDSCHKVDQHFKLKAGTNGWNVDEKMAEYALPAHDFFSLSRVKLWLQQKGFGAPQDGIMYPSTADILDLNHAGYSCDSGLGPSF